MPVERRHLVCRPVPILEERDLHRLHDWTLHMKVRVAPEADLRIASEIFIADVEPTDPGVGAVHDHDFSVIAKIELEPIRAAADSME